jgi:hypothetical protein
MTYVAASVSHFARRTHAPLGTWYRAVTCSARKIASNTSDTVGSSTQAASHGTDHAAIPPEHDPGPTHPVHLRPHPLDPQRDHIRMPLVGPDLSRRGRIARQPLSPVHRRPPFRRDVSTVVTVMARVIE